VASSHQGDPVSLFELALRWRSEAELFRRRGAVEAAATLEDCAAELEAACRERGPAEPTKRDAAQDPAHSRDRLRELARTGKLAFGRVDSGEIRGRRRDLPRRQP
jgi:hypothetical protein